MLTNRVKFIFAITLLLGSIGQVAADIYLPSLPSIVNYFGTTAHAAQLSVVFYISGYAASQLIYGPLSDGVGRRSPLLTGLVICWIGSIACVFSHNITTLVLGRCLQGLGAGAAVTLSRTILRDVMDGRQLAKLGSYIGIGNVAIMASAPALGGYFEYYFNWQASFIFIVVYTLIIVVITFFGLPETNQHIALSSLRWPGFKKNFMTLLTCDIFMRSAVLVGICYGGWLAWLTAGPIVLQNVIGLTPIQFGWTAFFGAMIYCVASYVNVQLIHRFSLLLIIRSGAVIMAIAGLLMMILYQCGWINSFVIVMPVMLFAIGTSFIFANIFALAFESIPHIAGLGSSFFSFVQIAGGAIASSYIAWGNDTNQLSLALVLLVGGACACVLTFKMQVNEKLIVRANARSRN